MAEVTKADLHDTRDMLLKQISDGFAGVHRRQDLTNGRIATVEGVTREHGVQIKNLEREVFRRSRDGKGDTTDGRRITERDVRMVVAGASGVVAIVTLFWKVLPLLLKAVTP